MSGAPVDPWQDNPFAPPRADLGPFPEAAGAAPRPIPFEDRERYPTLWLRTKETIVQGVKEHQAFLERTPLGDSLAKPWQFQMLAVLPWLAIVGLFMGVLVAIGAFASSGRPGLGLFGATALGLGALFLALLPALTFLGMLLAGAIDHACLWVWGGTKARVGLLQTIRGDAYAMGILNLLLLPLNLLSLVPLLGILASLAAMAALLVFLVFKGMALARMHRTEAWRGICAAFTPFLALCCLAVAAALAIPALLMAR